MDVGYMEKLHHFIQKAGASLGVPGSSPLQMPMGDCTKKDFLEADIK
jgi:hypothetical protein